MRTNIGSIVFNTSQDSYTTLGDIEDFLYMRYLYFSAYIVTWPTDDKCS